MCRLRLRLWCRLWISNNDLTQNNIILSTPRQDKATQTKQTNLWLRKLSKNYMITDELNFIMTTYVNYRHLF